MQCSAERAIQKKSFFKIAPLIANMFNRVCLAAVLACVPAVAGRVFGGNGLAKVPSRCQDRVPELVSSCSCATVRLPPTYFLLSLSRSSSFFVFGENTPQAALLRDHGGHVRDTSTQASVTRLPARPRSNSAESSYTSMYGLSIYMLYLILRTIHFNTHSCPSLTLIQRCLCWTT